MVSLFWCSLFFFFFFYRSTQWPWRKSQEKKGARKIPTNSVNSNSPRRPPAIIIVLAAEKRKRTRARNLWQRDAQDVKGLLPFRMMRLHLVISSAPSVYIRVRMRMLGATWKWSTPQISITSKEFFCLFFFPFVLSFFFRRRRKIRPLRLIFSFQFVANLQMGFNSKKKGTWNGNACILMSKNEKCAARLPAR